MLNSRLILLVDDDKDDQRFFVDAVASLKGNHQCIVADDGDKALLLLTQPLTIVPDFIFLDLNMPRMNGKGFLSKIKSIKLLQSIPVVIYSTTRQPEDVEETERLGAVYFLTKPRSFDDICDSISFVLEEKWKKSPVSEGHW